MKDYDYAHQLNRPPHYARSHDELAANKKQSSARKSFEHMKEYLRLLNYFRGKKK